jgi:acyl carrier protein
LARERPDGAFEFLGRRDTQVKIRGFRIEPGEIEAALRQHPGIRDCAVCVSEGPGADKHLVGYVVRRAERDPAACDLREFLSSRLPAHLVPSAWEFLTELPLNPNGKVDRAALLRKKSSLPGDQTSEPPVTNLENVIVSLWQEVLGERIFNVTDNFFDIGGDSLMLAQVHDRLCKRARLPVQLTDLFRFPTIRLLAKHLNEQMHAPAGAASAMGMDRGRAQRAMLERFRKT